MISGEESLLRIGELARRTGTDPALLRAWEKRYGLMQPTRTSGNFRLYSLEDLARVRAMKRQLARGFAAAEAARLAIAEPGEAPEQSRADNGPAIGSSQELCDALVRMDEDAAKAMLDRAFALSSLEDALEELVLPCLRTIGERWERDEVSVAEEHFASNLVRSRLLAIAEGWSSGDGPTALLACPSGERHDIGLISFGLILWRLGWRIVYVGQDTPPSETLGITEAANADVVIFAALNAKAFHDAADEIRELAARLPVAIGGAGAGEAIAKELGTAILKSNIVTAAHDVAAMVRPG